LADLAPEIVDLQQASDGRPSTIWLVLVWVPELVVEAVVHHAREAAGVARDR
jgi:hypothetical protein